MLAALMGAPLRAVSVLVAALTFPGFALADPNDLALNRLSFFNNTPWENGTVRYDPSRWAFRGGCGTPTTGGGGGQQYAQCFPDNQLFGRLVNELGGALAPSLMAPAMTLGSQGVYVGYELSISNLDRTSDHWRRGSQGSPTTVVGTDTSSQRDNGDRAAVVSRLHVRKGLPFGFELGTQVSHLHDSSIWAIGLDLRWSLFEGFHHGVGYLPDFAVRGAVNTVVGQSQLQLTVVSADAVISKRFTLGGVVRLTPYLGGQALFIFGDSAVVDLTPSRSAYSECPRQQIRYVPDMTSPSGQVGQLQCGSGGTLPSVNGAPIPSELNDTRNSAVFQSMRIWRPRMFLGLQLQWEVLMVTAEFTTDVAGPQWLSTPPASAGRPSTDPAQNNARQAVDLGGYTQWMTSIGVGLAFR